MCVGARDATTELAFVAEALDAFAAFDAFAVFDVLPAASSQTLRDDVVRRVSPREGAGGRSGERERTDSGPVVVAAVTEWSTTLSGPVAPSSA